MISNKIIYFIIILVILQLYTSTYQAKYNSLSTFKISDIPMSIKCMFQEKNCEQGDLDGWSLLHCFIYFCIGLVAPNKYLNVFIVSVLFEIIQPYLGNSARFILNPLCNITGYSLGSLIINKYNKQKNNT